MSTNNGSNRITWIAMSLAVIAVGVVVIVVNNNSNNNNNASKSSPSPSPSAVSILTTVAGDNINVKANNTFQISLTSNPTTGYSWSLSPSYDPAIVKQMSNNFVASTNGQVGASGTETWTFKGLKSGTTTLSFIYSRSWETDVPPVKTESYQVTVK